VKRTTVGSTFSNYLLGSAQAPSGTNGIYLGFGSDTLFFGDYATSGWDWYLSSSSVFRDTSAWYHVVAQYDSTQATSDRAKLYVNGVRLTAFDGASTYPGPSADSRFNQASVGMAIGRLGTYDGNYFNGYIAEVQFIDGQALTPSSFGETDATTGRWKAKAYTGTYGVNGFYLNFADNSGATATTLGKDSAPISGAHTTANNWTPNNLSVTPGSGNDSLVDSPTNFGSISTTLVDDTYQISKSLRFNQADQAHLTRTPTSASNRKTWTWSGWVKKTKNDAYRMLFVAGSNASNYTNLYFDATADRIEYFNAVAGANAGYYLTTGVSYKDPSVWNHIVLAVDTTAAAGQRAKLYVNGSQVNWTINTELGSSADTWVNSANLHLLGRDITNANQYLDGYLAEVHFVDGQALTPSSFGTRDINTYLWKPKAYAGTYGTNGFYLNFSDNSNTTATTLGKDQAGSNNWTPNNLSVTAGPGNDSLVDSPTYYGTDNGAGGEARGNYCAFNPLDKGSEVTLANGNLDVTWSGVNGHSVRSTQVISSGKWYWEVTSGGNASIGIIQSNIVPALNGWPGQSTYGATGSYAYAPDGRRVNNSTYSTYGSAISNGNIVGVAYDATNGRIFFSLNGTWQASGNPAAGTNAAYSGITGSFSPAIGYWTSLTSNVNSLNFGQRPFAYTAPSGFRALRDYNKLPVPTGGEVRGNYTTLNPLFGTTNTIQDGNLVLTGTAAGNTQRVGTMAVSSGKWYYEVTLTTLPASMDPLVGFTEINNVSAVSQYPGQGSTSYSIYHISSNTFLQKVNAGAFTNTNTTVAVQGDILGVALDLGSGRIWFSKNGTWVDGGNPSLGTNAQFTGISGTFAPAVRGTGGGTATTITANFGQRPWVYDAPFGFLPLCTTLLPQPIVQKPSTAMDVVTYTGTGATQSITSLGFSPDLLWTKGRSLAQSHNLFDTLRSGQRVRSDTTGAEAATTVTLGSNGFTLGTESESNNSGSTFVAWAWDAGSSSVTNTSGAISSTVRANPQAGVSVVAYTGTGSTSTVGHGLGVAPSLILCKTRAATVQWVVYHASLGKDRFLGLNTTAAAVTDSSYWGSGVTSTVFGLQNMAGGNNNGSMIAYCFAEIEGFSKFSSYTGNGSADGPFVYCGFRPRFLMIKRTDSAEPWIIKDTARSIYNGYDVEIYPNYSNAEGGPYSPPIMDYVSNGFKLRSTTTASNGSGGTIIFAAFAESPFKYSRAR
jgi:hypothetical protein